MQPEKPLRVVPDVAAREWIMRQPTQQHLEERAAVVTQRHRDAAEAAARRQTTGDRAVRVLIWGLVIACLAVAYLITIACLRTVAS